MEQANQIFFIAFSLIGLGLFLSAVHQYQANKASGFSIYWPLSVGFFSLSSFCFGIALWTHKFFLTIANTTFIVSVFLLIFLYRSWNQRPFAKIQIFLLWLIPAFIFFYYDHLRVMPDTFKQRVALITITQEIFLIWQIWELKRYYKANRTIVVKWLLFLSVFTLLGEVCRTLWVLFGSAQKNFFLYAHDVLALTLLWIGYGSTILVYVALSSFYLEKQIRKENQMTNALRDAKEENEKITQLLEERERLAYELIKVNKSTTAGALTASLAHELNQPIGASRIDLYSLKKLLQEQNLYTNEVKELLERMEFDNQRSGGIVDTLHSIFKQDRPVMESVPISDLVQATVDLATREMKLADIAIDINIPKELVINVGRVEMQQVLLNLLNNAIHALKGFDAPNAKSIWIAARKTDTNTIEIMVQDNGPGVDPAIANDIFTLFLTKKKSGLGVGLWLCQYILSRYEAEISYRPRTGGGSAFIIRMKDSQ